MDNIVIDEKQLPEEAKQFIEQVKYSSQKKIDELQEEVQRRPVTIAKAKQILH